MKKPDKYETAVNRMIEGKSSHVAIFEVCLAMANCTSDRLRVALEKKLKQLEYELEQWAKHAESEGAK